MPQRKPDPLAALFQQVLGEIGADSEPAHLDLVNTPARIARMLRDELLVGYKRTDKDLLRQMTVFPSKGQRSMVVVRGIDFTSVCAHHMLPFSGTAAVGYLPGEKLVGLSKLPRLVHHYAARFQMQEHLGEQCAEFLHKHVGATFVAVLLEAEHACMRCRGVRQSHATTITQSTRPLPPDEKSLDEFHRLLSWRS